MKRTSLTALSVILLAGAASANGFRAGTLARVPGSVFRGSVNAGPQLHTPGVKLDARWTSPIAFQTGTSLRVEKLDGLSNLAPDMIRTQKSEDDQRQKAMPLLQDVADKTISFDMAFDGRKDVEMTEDAVFGGESRNTVSLGRRTNIVQEKVAVVEKTGRRAVFGKALGLTALFSVLSQSLFASQTSGGLHLDPLRVTIIAGGLSIAVGSALVYVGLILPWSSRRTEARLRALPGVTKVESEGNSVNGQTGFRVEFEDEAAFTAANLPLKLNGWYLEQYVGGKYMSGLLK